MIDQDLPSSWSDDDLQVNDRVGATQEINETRDLGNNAQICKQQWDQLMLNKKKPKVVINPAEICQDNTNQEIVNIFQCIYCHGIPIDPHECSKCEVVFCFECKQTSDRVADNYQSRRCPQCRDTLQTKKMNKNLHALTIEKLKFEHICFQEASQQQVSNSVDSQAQPQKELSAFEKFKLTPAYQLILQRHGKLNAPASSDKQATVSSNNHAAQSGNQVNSSAAGGSLQNKPQPQKRIYTYQEYLKHLKGDSCSKYKIYTCPLKCEPDYENKKMSYREYLVHIKQNCKKVIIQCTRCNQTTERSAYKKHQTKTCISNLSKGIQKAKQELRAKKSHRKTKLDQYFENDKLIKLAQN